MRISSVVPDRGAPITKNMRRDMSGISTLRGLDPNPSGAIGSGVSKLYTSGEYATLNPDWHEGDALHKASVITALLLGHAMRPAEVVDVGCGSGLVLRACRDLLGPQGWSEVRFEGWDIAEAAIGRAARWQTEGLSYHHGDFTAEARVVDLALCVDVFEHLPDPAAFLARLASTARAVVFRIPLDDCVYYRARPSRLRRLEQRYGHLHHYHRASALRLLRSAGFEIRASMYDRVPLQPGGLRGAVVDAIRVRAFSRWPDACVRGLGGWSLLVLAHSGENT